eukprot:UN11476
MYIIIRERYINLISFKYHLFTEFSHFLSIHETKYRT